MDKVENLALRVHLRTARHNHRNGTTRSNLLKAFTPVGFYHACAKLGGDATAKSKIAGVSLLQLFTHSGNRHHRDAILFALINELR